MKEDNALYDDSDRSSIDYLVEFSCGSSSFDEELFYCINDTNIKAGGVVSF
jgi:hypothetical protein